jgi:hypothetical protein
VEVSANLTRVFVRVALEQRRHRVDKAYLGLPAFLQ